MHARLAWMPLVGALTAARPAAAQVAAVFEPGAAFRLPSGGMRQFELSWHAGMMSRPFGATVFGAVDLDLDGDRISSRLALLPRYRRTFGRAAADLSLGPLLVLPGRGAAAQTGAATELAVGWPASLELTTRLELNRGVAWYGGVKLGSDHADEAVETEAVVLAIYATVKVVEWLRKVRAFSFD